MSEEIRRAQAVADIANDNATEALRVATDAKENGPDLAKDKPIPMLIIGLTIASFLLSGLAGLISYVAILPIAWQDLAMFICQASVGLGFATYGICDLYDNGKLDNSWLVKPVVEKLLGLTIN